MIVVVEIKLKLVHTRSVKIHAKINIVIVASFK
jgi:hypothetical protein